MNLRFPIPNKNNEEYALPPTTTKKYLFYGGNDMKNFKTNLYENPRLPYEESEFNHKSHYKDNNTGFECCKEYDKNGIMVHYLDSEGCESWQEYDKRYRIFHFKNPDGSGYSKKYNKRGELISYTPHINVDYIK